MTQNKLKIIGLTGNSGSGKSTVSQILSEYAYIIDSDEIAHSVLLKGTDCYKEVVNQFGQSILDSDNNIIRKKLGEIIFSDKEKHITLTKITHKYIIEIVINRVNNIQNTKNKKFDYIIIDIPILIGNKIQNIVDEIWVVYANEETLINRITKRDNITINEAKNRIDKQMSFEQLRQYADIIIENNGTYEQLKKQVTKFINI